ncbi:MAG: Stk1 family PASTA domain-containing Ser/Thr kinase [Pseudonocardiaceae bacterium]
MTSPRLLSERYELGEVLGYGGMSEVHRGKDMRLSRDVAVKVLRADLARDPQFQIRFRREAQNAAALNHPAIVAVYDTGETTTEYGPLPYIVMEYVDGRTLRDIVQTEGPMGSQRAMETMADVCAALDFSHRAGIIHRDVKPANIMITTAGAVKVMDFGIARALADGGGITQTAAVIGTAQYLSPEQARGEQVDGRSDVYAAGCVFYELLTGSPPFTGDSPVAVAYQHVREDPKRPSDENPDIPAALDAVVLRSMSKNPANRYQSAAEMRTDLVRVLAGQRPQAPMVMTDAERTTLLTAGSSRDMGSGRHRPDLDDSGRRSRTPLVLAGLALAAVAAVLLLLFTDVFGGGPTQVAVPDVVGQPFEVAQDTLIQNGFRVDRVDVASPPEDVNRVLGSEPRPDTRADQGSTVTLQVGAGPDVVEVPNLVGLTPEQAQQSLADVGLSLSPNPAEQRVVADESQRGRIVESRPSAGQQVAEGGTVAIVLGSAPAMVNVPNVVGTNVDQAQSNLEGAGLQVQVQEIDATEPQNQVVDQNPDGGTQVEAGATVTLSVSRGNQLEMPDLSGLTQQQAQQRLTGLGWTGQLQVRGVVTDDSAELGRVVNQDVPPGSPFQADQTITIDLGTDEDGSTTPPGSSFFPPGFPGG